MWEGLLLSLGGAIVGGLISIPIAVYMNTHGIQLPPEYGDKMPFPMEGMTSKNVWTDWLLVTGICLVTGVIGAFKPSRTAAETNIVDALKKGVR
jgi:ABC-type lipoprotein release transport system permease subunit